MTQFLTVGCIVALAATSSGAAAATPEGGCRDLQSALDVLTSLGGFQLDLFEELLRLAQAADRGPQPSTPSTPGIGSTSPAAPSPDTWNGAAEQEEEEEEGERDSVADRELELYFGNATADDDVLYYGNATADADDDAWYNGTADGAYYYNETDGGTAWDTSVDESTSRGQYGGREVGSTGLTEALPPGSSNVAEGVMAGTQPWTIFVPTDAALAAAAAALAGGAAAGNSSSGGGGVGGSGGGGWVGAQGGVTDAAVAAAALESVDPGLLDQVLALHVVPQPVQPFSEDEAASQVATLSGPQLGLIYASNQQGASQPALKYLKGPQQQDVTVEGFVSTPLCSGGYVYVIDTLILR